MHCSEVRRGTATGRRRCRHRLPRRCVLRCGAGPCMARRWLLHGGAAVRTFWEKQENLGMRQNSGNSAGILVRLQNFAIFHANSYTLSLKLTQRFPSEILPSGLRPKSDKFRQGVSRVCELTKWFYGLQPVQRRVGVYCLFRGYRFKETPIGLRPRSVLQLPTSSPTVPHTRSSKGALHRHRQPHAPDALFSLH